MAGITSFKVLRPQLLAWWVLNGRHDLPWKIIPNNLNIHQTNCQNRVEEIDPYQIWIAEVMLQQTQLPVMLPYWHRWMIAFPNIQYLAAAPRHKVLFLWQGLGYYSRAKFIHEAAHLLKGAPWPRTLEAWMSLPGIGRTTAGSILSSAFNLPFPILDGNVRRIFSRLIADKGITEKKLWIISHSFLDKERPRDFNQALMDLGSKVCTPNKPKCMDCPLRCKCSAYSLGQTEIFPLKKEHKPLPQEVIGIGVVFNSRDQVLIDQRFDEGLLGGLWEFPGGKQEKGEEIKTTIQREILEELAIKIEIEEHLITFQHSYSHKRLSFVVHICRLIEGDPKPLASQQVKWVSPNQLDEYPFPAANAKIILALIKYLKQKIL